LAELAQAQAQIAIDFAEDEAERIEAQAQAIEADRQYAEAIAAVVQSQYNLAIAIANQTGDVQGALQAQVDAAQAALDAAIAAGAGEAEVNDLTADLIAAQLDQQQGLIDEQVSDWQFLHDIGQITTQQFIAYLQGLLATIDPVAQEDLFQQITLMIQDLKGSANDLQFNLPDVFGNPTLYIARALAQSTASTIEEIQNSTPGRPPSSSSGSVSYGPQPGSDTTGPSAGLGSEASGPSAGNAYYRNSNVQNVSISMNVYNDTDARKAVDILRKALGRTSSPRQGYTVRRY
jgi:hypothetical protein